MCFRRRRRLATFCTSVFLLGFWIVSELQEVLPDRRQSDRASALRRLRLSASLGGRAAAVGADQVRRCLSRRHRPLRLMFAGHSRVWQLFWAAVERTGARLRSRSAPAHGPPYGGDPPPLNTAPNCVEVFLRPDRPPACSWAADAPGLQLDMRWRDHVNTPLSLLIQQAALPHHRPDLLVLAIGMKDAVRDKQFRSAPQRLQAALRSLVAPQLRQLTRDVTTVLLLDYPTNRWRARVEYDRGTGAALMAQNALFMEELAKIPGLHIWTSAMPHAVQFYAETCRGVAQPPEVATSCRNDTFHPGAATVNQLLDQLLHIVC